MNTVPLSVLINAEAAMKFAMHDYSISAKSFNQLNQAHAPLVVLIEKIIVQQKVEVTA